VLGEGIRVLVAVPTLHGGEVTGMVYCGHRSDYDAAAPQTGDLVRRVRQLSVDLARLGYRQEPQRNAASEQLYPDLDPSGREALRHTYAELRAIRSGIVDDETRERLTAVEARLADILSGHNPDNFQTPVPAVRLSPRETDILSHVALGWSNARIAETLGLRERRWSPISKPPLSNSRPAPGTRPSRSPGRRTSSPEAEGGRACPAAAGSESTAEPDVSRGGRRQPLMTSEFSRSISTDRSAAACTAASAMSKMPASMNSDSPARVVPPLLLTACRCAAGSGCRLSRRPAPSAVATTICRAMSSLSPCLTPAAIMASARRKK